MYMDGYNARRAMSHYQQMATQSEVGDASPHRLVQMMLDGALARVTAARGALDAGETARKGEFIGKAIGLIEGLRVSLDHDRGGEIATNLGALYDYFGRRLLEANLRNDGAILDEVADLLREIGTGWSALGDVPSQAATGPRTRV
jgi:flagellar protein FliS